VRVTDPWTVEIGGETFSDPEISKAYGQGLLKDLEKLLSEIRGRYLDRPYTLQRFQQRINIYPPVVRKVAAAKLGLEQAAFQRGQKPSNPSYENVLAEKKKMLLNGIG
jgi:hypothetical protein